ncbi:MAG: type II toxin-antitoxin system HicB family antitoxin [Chlorobium sp.]|jgi:hypothetical protein|nr:type II toxin-antitoxin system HicB family antitoxin [Chlorobium sp.]
MSCFAMSSLKDASLLDFEKRRMDEPESLHGVFGVRIIPCDSQMRTSTSTARLSPLLTNDLWATSGIRFGKATPLDDRFCMLRCHVYSCSIRVVADFKNLSDVFIIPALNKDVNTFDQMALALYYHMYQKLIVAHVEKRDSKSAQELDPRLQSALKHRNYSFLLWCLGCGLSPAETASKLQEQPGEYLSPAHEAVRRDFPIAYAEIFDEIPPAKESWRVRTRAPRLSLHVIWDEDRAGYVASVLEVPGVMAIGKNWTEALENMLDMLRLQRFIDLLNNVLEIRGLGDKAKSAHLI